MFVNENKNITAIPILKSKRRCVYCMVTETIHVVVNFSDFCFKPTYIWDNNIKLNINHNYNNNINAMFNLFYTQLTKYCISY